MATARASGGDRLNWEAKVLLITKDDISLLVPETDRYRNVAVKIDRRTWVDFGRGVPQPVGFDMELGDLTRYFAVNDKFLITKVRPSGDRLYLHVVLNAICTERAVHSWEQLQQQRPCDPIVEGRTERRGGFGAIGVISAERPAMRAVGKGRGGFSAEWGRSAMGLAPLPTAASPAAPGPSTSGESDVADRTGKPWKLPPPAKTSTPQSKQFGRSSQEEREQQTEPEPLPAYGVVEELPFPRNPVRVEMVMADRLRVKIWRGRAAYFATIYSRIPFESKPGNIEACKSYDVDFVSRRMERPENFDEEWGVASMIKWFCVGDEFQIRVVRRIEDRYADWEVLSCACVQIIDRTEDELLGAVFSGFDMPRVPGETQKKAFLTCPFLDRDKMNLMGYETMQAVAFPSQFPARDISRGINVRVKNGAVVQMKCGYEPGRRWATVQHAEVASDAEARELQFPPERWNHETRVNSVISLAMVVNEQECESGKSRVKNRVVRGLTFNFYDDLNRDDRRPTRMGFVANFEYDLVPDSVEEEGSIREDVLQPPTTRTARGEQQQQQRGGAAAGAASDEWWRGYETPSGHGEDDDDEEEDRAAAPRVREEKFKAEGFRGAPGQDVLCSMHRFSDGKSILDFKATVSWCSVTPPNHHEVKLSFPPRTQLDLLNRRVPQQARRGKVTFSVREKVELRTYRQVERELRGDLRDRLLSMPSRRTAADPVLKGKDLVLAELTGLHKRWLDLPKTSAIKSSPLYASQEKPDVNMVRFMILVDERPLVFIKGPPGTGKTHNMVLCACLAIFNPADPEVPEKILMLAKTNLAADQLAVLINNLAKQNYWDEEVRVCRLYARSVPATSADRDCHDFSPWLLAEDDEPDERATEEIRTLMQQLRKLKASLRDRRPDELEGAARQDCIRDMREMIKTMERQIRPALRRHFYDLINPNVVVTTVQHAGALKFGENVQDVVDFGTDAVWKDDIEEFYRRDRKRKETELNKAVAEALAKMATGREPTPTFEDVSPSVQIRRQPEDDDDPDVVVLEAEELREEMKETQEEAELEKRITSDYTKVFVDECGQVNQRDMAIAALQLKETRETTKVKCSLWGDPSQLKPHANCEQGVCGRIAQESSMELAVQEHLAPVVMLKECYRMNSHILEFVSKYCYDGELRPMVKDEDRAMLSRSGYNLLPLVCEDVIQQQQTADAAAAAAADMSIDDETPAAAAAVRRTPLRLPLMFFDHRHPEDMGAGASRYNRVETCAAVQIIDSLTGSGRVENKVPATSITVLVGYEAQRLDVVRMVQRTTFWGLSNEQKKQLTIKTVDSYQGREQDVVIFLCTRSNDAGELGFMSDQNRLTVAFSRARHGLIVVGNLACLTASGRCQFWNNVRTFFDAKGAHREITYVGPGGPTVGGMVLKNQWNMTL